MAGPSSHLSRHLRKTFPRMTVSANTTSSCRRNVVLSCAASAVGKRRQLRAQLFNRTALPVQHEPMDVRGPRVRPATLPCRDVIAVLPDPDRCPRTAVSRDTRPRVGARGVRRSCARGGPGAGGSASHRRADAARRCRATEGAARSPASRSSASWVLRRTRASRLRRSRRARGVTSTPQGARFTRIRGKSRAAARPRRACTPPTRLGRSDPPRGCLAHHRAPRGGPRRAADHGSVHRGTAGSSVRRSIASRNFSFAVISP